jgi:hypothetical protein
MNCELQQPFVPTVVVESVWESLFVEHDTCKL